LKQTKLKDNIREEQLVNYGINTTEKLRYKVWIILRTGTPNVGILWYTNNVDALHHQGLLNNNRRPSLEISIC